MTLGVLGAGQLGRMLALAGAPLDVRCVFLDPDPSSPASHVGECIVGAYDDPVALGRLADRAGAVTFEFENVPASSAHLLEQRVPIFPPPGALAAAQDRLAEKRLFQALGIPTPRCAPVDSLESLEHALADLGTPAVLKTRRLGYDGKGQRVIRAASDAPGAWRELAGAGAHAQLILEELVVFTRELSVLAVRGRTQGAGTPGPTVFYPLVENHHAGGILRLSLAPAPGLDPALQALAESHARAVLDRLGYVGVLAIEFFEVPGAHAGAPARLLASEMACRVHNSGHWTIEGASTSQFENHLRAGLGWPLGSTAPTGHSGMVNLIGDAPPTGRLLGVPGAHVHLYAKQPREGRKLGHVTVVAPTPAQRDAMVRQVRDAVEPGSAPAR